MESLEPRQTESDRATWRSLCLMLALASVVLVARAVSICSAQSERYDDEYHLWRGVRYFSHGLDAVPLNDAVFGAALTALPVLPFANAATRPGATVLYDSAISPETILLVVGIWKSILFLPMLGVVFAWVRSLYGLASAWGAAALLLVDPTFAAHIPLPTLDVLGVEAIVVACWLAWRFFERPSLRRLVLVAIAIPLAMEVKHTAIILPAIVLLVAAVHYSRYRVEDPARAHGRLGLTRTRVAVAVIVALLSFWAASGFDVTSARPIDIRATSRPAPHWLADLPIPAGTYVRSVIEGMSHAAEGHFCYLNGELRIDGWWYYFPVLATYKVPIPFALLGVVAAASFLRRRWTFAEHGVLIPLFCYTLLLINSNINIGFRHALPAYVFCLILLSRAFTLLGMGWRPAAWACVAAAAVESIAWSPNYLSYLNYPRDRAYLRITDSNIDWGQSLKHVAHWLDANPSFVRGRPVHLRYFGNRFLPSIPHYLGDRVRTLQMEDGVPDHGVLLISPVFVVGCYDVYDQYSNFRKHRPADQIAHSILVFDLDEIARKKSNK